MILNKTDVLDAVNLAIETMVNNPANLTLASQATGAATGLIMGPIEGEALIRDDRSFALLRLMFVLGQQSAEENWEAFKFE